MNTVISAKTELLDLIQSAREAHHSFVDSLSENERNASGTFDYKDWTAKDVVAHCTFWMRQSHDRMEKVRHGEMPEAGVEGVDEQMNAQNYEQWRDRSWADVLAETEQVFDLLTEDIAPFSDEDLKKPGYFPQSDRTIFGLYVGNVVTHPQIHCTDYYLLRDDVAQAEIAQEKAAQGFKRLSDSYSQGVGEYNLACFYARTNRPERALALLPGALQLAPDLIEWSKKDPDLESLHGKPEFAALYTN